MFKADAVDLLGWSRHQPLPALMYIVYNTNHSVIHDLPQVLIAIDITGQPYITL